MNGLTLDAGALIALERLDRRLVVLLNSANARKMRLAVPATALAQVLREPRRQVNLMRMLRQPLTEVIPLDRTDASFVGQLLRHARTRDIVDAHVAVVAQRRRDTVVTSDPKDLAAMVPGLRLVTV